MPGAVDPVVIGVAFEDEALGWRFCLEHPRFEGRQVRIVVPVHDVHFAVQCRPVARADLFDELVQLFLVGVFLVKLLQVVRRAVDVHRVGPRQRRQEQRVGPRPAKPHGACVEHLEFRPLSVRQHRDRQTAWRQVGIFRDVLEPVAEILGREGLPVRPFVPGPQPQRKHPVVLDIGRFENVGDEGERRRIGDEPRIAVDDHEPRVFRARHQHAQIAARPPQRLEFGERRRARHPLVDRRQRAFRHCLGEHPRFDQRRPRRYR